MKKFLLILTGIVVFGSCAFSIESDFKNSLLKADFVKVGANDYNIRLFTQKPYSEPIKVIKKTNTSYYLLLPETFHSVGSIAPTGDIKSAEVKLFPYAGQDLNNGYTKISIYTTKPVNITPKLSTSTGSVAPSIDAKKLAQLDSAFNTKQAQMQARERQAQYEAQQKQIQQQKALEAQKLKQQQEAAKAQAQQKAQLEARKLQEQKAAQERQARLLAQQEAQKKAQAQAQRQAQLEAQRKAREAKRLEEQRLALQRAQAQKAQQVQKPANVQTSSVQLKDRKQTRTSGAPVAKPVQSAQKTMQKPAQSKQDTTPVKKEQAQVPISPVTAELPAQQSTEVQIPRNIDEEANSSIVTEDLTNNPELDKTIAQIPDTLDKKETKVSFVEILKDKLLRLKPYYYIIIDNPVLIIASLVAIVGIIMLILLNRSKKGHGENMQQDTTLSDTTEKSDLEALNNDTAPEITPSANEAVNDDIQSFKDEFKDLAYDIEPERSSVSTATSEVEIEEPYIEPEVLSSVEIAPGRGFMVIDRQGVKALFGYINDDVFLIYQFREYISNYDIKFRISEKQDDKTFFIVKIDKFKLLVRVTNKNMRLELEM